ncbi:50S ribosomal protein L28 [Candidatus Babeliales bacterium]|nr:50S ribosomal protein L28 [Candidatus Babeliales bacterium]
MANICAVCGKRPRVVNTVSNANNKVKQWSYPNVHVMRFRYLGKTNVFRGNVCTRCVRTGKIEKVV